MRTRRSPLGGCSGRLLMALLVMGFAVFSYVFGTREVNPVTGENQRVDLSADEEIVLGLEAAPEMIQEFGGLYPDDQVQGLVDQIGQSLLDGSIAGDSGYQYEFYVLADTETINAFALPGGQVFITAALLGRLESEGQIAGVLAHEIGHVEGRHTSEQIAKARLTEGLTAAAVVAAYDPNDPNSAYAAQMAQLIGQTVNMRFSRDHELESDRLGVRFMVEAGYDPRAMIRVMEILAEASDGQRPPEFFSTHPNPENRIEKIQQAIAEEFPNGVPDGLIALIVMMWS